MKNSFTLFELLIVIVLLAILATFAINKYLDSTRFANKVKIKSEIAMIRNNIDKLQNKNILKGEENSFLLDDASIDMKNSKLFNNILEFPLLSTSTEEKELASWIKKTSSTYQIYFNKNEFLEFRFQDFNFKCISDKNICKEFE